MISIEIIVFNCLLLLSSVLTKDSIKTSNKVMARTWTKSKSLCEDTYINAADRFPNNTVRVYRDEFYWDLIGLPERRAKVMGPFPIWQQNMGSTDGYTAFQTVTKGELKGVTFKYSRGKYWSWNPDGSPRSGGESGEKWSYRPIDNFYAAYNDGDMDQKGYSTFLAFSGIKVFYYNTTGNVFKPINDSNGYVGGQYGEKFPDDLTAAFAYPNSDTNKNYYVYLFKQKQYCFRTYLGVENCTEWRDNSELFNCPKDTVPSETNETNSNNISEGPLPLKSATTPLSPFNESFVMFLILFLLKVLMH